MENQVWHHNVKDKFGPADYKAYTEDSTLVAQINKLKGCKKSCRYMHPNGTTGWDLLVSKEQCKRVLKILNVSTIRK